MKMFLISDNTDTLVGMRLSGVEGIVVKTGSEIRKALSDIDEETGLVFVTDIVYQKEKELFDSMIVSESFPIVSVIPDRHGSNVLDINNIIDEML